MGRVQALVQLATCAPMHLLMISACGPQQEGVRCTYVPRGCTGVQPSGAAALIQSLQSSQAGHSPLP